MFLATYGRKSIYSDHSDSIDNQFRMCREYIAFKFPGENTIETYSDEAYTGANTDRPDLQRLLADVRAGLVDALVVYQLDRLSRDVRDFSNIYSLLEEHHVMFISIKENIDTTTPIGKAMMYVTVVFAQMERETIAARVTDNMLGLAKKGYWTGGNPPVGYVRKKITVNGKNHVTIEPDPEGAKYVVWIFDTFLNNHHSLQSMETAFRRQGIRTQNGAFFSTVQLYKILTQPFCCPATPEVYDFYEAKGCQMDPGSPRELWDGSRGVMVYRRSTNKNKKHQLNPPEKWLVCIGQHRPFLPADKWLAVQEQFAGNKFDKSMKYDVPLLKGVLRCSCGSMMATSRKKKLEGVSSWYYCIRRMRQGTEACTRRQVKTDVIDNKVLNIFRAIEANPKQIYKFAAKNNREPKVNVKAITAQITACEGKIGRLTATLALTDNSAAAKYIVAEMERLDLELQALKRERSMAQSDARKGQEAAQTLGAKAEAIGQLIRGLDGFTAVERNEIVRDVVKECVWDGQELFVTL